MIRILTTLVVTLTCAVSQAQFCVPPGSNVQINQRRGVLPFILGCAGTRISIQTPPCDGNGNGEEQFLRDMILMKILEQRQQPQVIGQQQIGQDQLHGILHMYQLQQLYQQRVQPQQIPIQYIQPQQYYQPRSIYQQPLGIQRPLGQVDPYARIKTDPTNRQWRVQIDSRCQTLCQKDANKNAQTMRLNHYFGVCGGDMAGVGDAANSHDIPTCTPRSGNWVLVGDAKAQGRNGRWYRCRSWRKA